MTKDPLNLIAGDEFKDLTCLGEMKPFKDLTLWNLLNLWLDIILGFADTMYAKYGITSKYLEDALREHSIQTTRKMRWSGNFIWKSRGRTSTWKPGTTLA